MKTNQAWGWLAAAVVAAGLNASYHDGGLRWAHQMVSRVEQNAKTTLALATGKADLFLAEARLFSAEEQAPTDPLTNAFAEVRGNVLAKVSDNAMEQVRTVWADHRAEFDRFEAISACNRTKFARLEANRARMEAVLDARRARLEAQLQARVLRVRLQNADFTPAAFESLSVHVACPRVRMNMPKMPIKMPEIPEVHVDLSGLGPA